METVIKPQSGNFEWQSNKEMYEPLTVRAIVEDVDYPGLNCFIYVHPADWNGNLVKNAWRTRVICSNLELRPSGYEACELYAYTPETIQKQRRLGEEEKEREFAEWYARLEDIAAGKPVVKPLSAAKNMIDKLRDVKLFDDDED